MKIKTDSNSFYFALLLLLSAFTHFYSYGEPQQVVFDEVHFGKFVNSYCCSSQRIFDIHPPHAKILIAYTARLFGYRGEQDFSKISNPFKKEANWPLRLFPTLMGILLVPIIFTLMIQLKASQPAAFFAALLLLLDTALLTQSRLIVLDSLLLVAIFSSITLVIWADKQNSLYHRLIYFAIAGVLAALAVGTKFTGLVALAMPFFYACSEIIKQPNVAKLKHWLLAALAFLIAFGMIYLAGWYIHFSQLNQPGPGDIWGILKGSFFDNLVNIHITMFKANANLTTPHHDASMWWGWPFMHNPIYYWNGMGNKIYLLGNPLVWWSSFALFISALLTSLLMKVSNLTIKAPEIETQELPKVKKKTSKKREKHSIKKISSENNSFDNKSVENTSIENTSVENKRHEKPLLWFPLFGYLVAFLPLVWVSRPLFLYHYFTPLLFSILFVVLWLDKIGWFKAGNLLQQRWSVYIYLMATVLAFITLSPLSYGLEHSTAISDMIFSVFPLWR